MAKVKRSKTHRRSANFARTRDLLILGSGVHSLEMVEIVERVNQAAQATGRQPTWNLLGFLAPSQQHVGEIRNGCRVLGTLRDLKRFPRAALIHDNEWPQAQPIPRERLVNLIDPSCFISRTARLGAGCVIYPNCYIGLNARLGDDIFMLSGCIVNHDDRVEDRTVFASQVTLAGSVHVESGCYLGQSSTVRQFIRIDRGSMIGMGAVVIADVPANSVMVGNPAYRLRDREPVKKPRGRKRS